MPRDTIHSIDLSHEVYEDLPDFILSALTEPDVENILLDPGGLVRRHKRGIFDDIGHLAETVFMRFLRKVAESVGRYFDGKHPFIRAILPNGERVEAVFPTVSVDGLSMVLRVPGPLITLEEQVQRGTMTEDQRRFLESVAGLKNIIVVGTAGSGKTNVLRGILATESAQRKRQISIEADPEVAKPANGVRLIDIEPEPGEAAVPFMRLVRSALRLLPELVIVSEVLTAEHAKAFVHASRGHVGASTFHARTPLVALNGIRQLANSLGDEPAEDVALACEIVVQVEDIGAGNRRISQISTIGVDNDERFTVERVA
jgi:Flp pilus assembly CpaF family ATPase